MTFRPYSRDSSGPYSHQIPHLQPSSTSPTRTPRPRATRRRFTVKVVDLGASIRGPRRAQRRSAELRDDPVSSRG